MGDDPSRHHSSPLARTVTSVGLCMKSGPKLTRTRPPSKLQCGAQGNAYAHTQPRATHTLESVRSLQRHCREVSAIGHVREGAIRSLLGVGCGQIRSGHAAAPLPIHFEADLRCNQEGVLRKSSHRESSTLAERTTVQKHTRPTGALVCNEVRTQPPLLANTVGAGKHS